MVTDVPDIASNLTRDPDRLERVSSTASGGLWAGPAKVNVRWFFLDLVKVLTYFLSSDCDILC